MEAIQRPCKIHHAVPSTGCAFLGATDTTSTSLTELKYLIMRLLQRCARNSRTYAREKFANCSAAFCYPRPSASICRHTSFRPWRFSWLRSLERAWCLDHLSMEARPLLQCLRHKGVKQAHALLRKISFAPRSGCCTSDQASFQRKKTFHGLLSISCTLDCCFAFRIHDVSLCPTRKQLGYEV